VALDDANEETGRRTTGIGPTGRTVAQNVARLRGARQLTVIGLAKRLSDLGHPILSTAITKIELGQRRVTTDDLVALAVALEVNLSALILPLTTSGLIEITGAGAVPGDDAWNWADGVQPLNLPPDDDGSAWNDFQLQGRPVGRRRFRA
jgi:transcriptional regulator with XRE-family HTH domain